MTAEPHVTPLMPAVVGFVLAGALVLLLGFWVASRPPRVHPQLALLAPRQDTVLHGPIRVQFQTSLPLRLQATGWGSGSYHVHALLDSTELMPAAADLRAIGPNQYEWVLPALEKPQRLQLVWALPNHARLPMGSSSTVRIAPRIASADSQRVW